MLVQRSALVPYSAQSMFALVDDVATYPQFLPWCAASEVRTIEGARMEAGITIGYRGLNQAFVTRNLREQSDQGARIEMQLVDGPFKRLEGLWQFQSLREDASKVLLDVDFEFANKVLGAVAGPVFSQIVGSLVDAFVKRAEQVYGQQ
ncbi:MAG: type II toxin-antitoxin system RatA family toxin [Gammaproteobacteria bacterium]